MTQVDTLSAPQIRERMSHPSIDGDGHLIEVREAFFANTAVESAVEDYLRG